MSNTDKDITYTLKGERAAMGGYLAQYDTFAIGIYDAMEAGTLEEPVWGCLLSDVFQCTGL